MMINKYMRENGPRWDSRFHFAQRRRALVERAAPGCRLLDSRTVRVSARADVDGLEEPAVNRRAALAQLLKF